MQLSPFNLSNLFKAVMFLNDSGGNSKTLTTSNFNMNIVDISTVTIISIEFSFNSRIFSIHFRYIRKFTISNYIQYITLLRLLFVFNENVNKNLLNFGTKMDASNLSFLASCLCRWIKLNTNLTSKSGTPCICSILDPIQSHCLQLHAYWRFNSGTIILDQTIRLPITIHY